MRPRRRTRGGPGYAQRVTANSMRRALSINVDRLYETSASAENGGARADHGSGGTGLLRAEQDPATLLV